jgi:adenylylsulfate kinase-like enzyme
MDKKLTRNQRPDRGLLEPETRGLYQLVGAGEIKEFTGISSPYEPPERPELILNIGSESRELRADRVVALLQQRDEMHKSKGKQA